MKSFHISSKIRLFFWKDFWLAFKITMKRLFFKKKETKESLYSLFDTGYPLTKSSMSLDVSSLLKQSMVGTSHMRSCWFCSIYFTLNFCWFHTVCHIKENFQCISICSYINVLSFTVVMHCENWCWERNNCSWKTE